MKKKDDIFRILYTVCTQFEWHTATRAIIKFITDQNDCLSFQVYELSLSLFSDLYPRLDSLITAKLAKRLPLWLYWNTL